MIYYFLPDRGLFGGVKVGVQLVELLSSLGVRSVAVLPEGKAPLWFKSRAAVVSEEMAWERLSPQDWLMITWPPDYHRLMHRGRLICHCQGTDALMEPIFADLDVPILTCWDQADEYVRIVHGRSTLPIGIAVSDCFFHDGSSKWDNRVAYMPRRGWEIVKACMQQNDHLDYQPIEGVNELGVARRLMSSGIYLSTSVGEQFGLPALEAMAAGCVVLSVPVKGGMEYLQSGINCLVVQPEEMPGALVWLADPKQAELRRLYRARAVKTALKYHMSEQRKTMMELLRGELHWLFDQRDLG